MRYRRVILGQTKNHPSLLSNKGLLERERGEKEVTIRVFVGQMNLHDHISSFNEVMNDLSSFMYF